MQLCQIRYILPFQRIVFAFLVVIVFICFNGCNQSDNCSNIARCEMLDSIEVQMFQSPEYLDSLIGQIDTTHMTPHEQARMGAIRGFFNFENGEYDKSIYELEKAETYFFNQGDHYHLHICKLIKAFTFEYINLDHNAPVLYVECEDYFNIHHLDKLKFYATLGLYRMAKPLQLDENVLLERLQKAAVQLNDPNYSGLLNATMGVLVKNDSLKTIYYEQAKSELIFGQRWSRVYAVELNLLFLKIKQDPSENTQIFYNNFPNKAYFYRPDVEEQMRYKHAQAYLYAKQRKDKLSIEVANQVLNEAVAFKITKVESDCVELLVYLYKRTGDFANAHAMLERYHALQKKKLDALQKNQLLALGAHYRYSELEGEKLELKLKVQKTRFWIGVFILVIFILGSLFWLSSKKSKHKQEVLKLKNMEIQDQLDNLIRSLNSQETKDEKLIRQSEELSNQYKDSLMITEFLKAIEKKEVKTWMEYESFFHDLRPGWIEKLNHQVPGLTATDLKYCMCFYFNLTNYQITKLCDNGSEAIKAAKKRIRKKFELKDATEIYLFLKNIG